MENLVNPTPQFWKDKKVLLTGHTGFKGSWLTAALLDFGAKVSGIALPPDASQPSLFNLLGLEQKIDHYFTDIREFAEVDAIVKKVQPEIVIHMAAQALVLPSYEDPVSTYSTNIMGTVHLLEACRKSNSVQCIINVTSDKCYENKEWLWAYREDEPMGGYDPYSNSKGCSELVTSAYRRSFFKEKGIHHASARAGNVIGGGDWADNRLIPDFIRAIGAGDEIEIRNPNAIRPWQHVLEPLSGYLALAEKLYGSEDYAEGWNFGPFDENAKPVSHLANKIVDIWGSDAKVKMPDPSASNSFPHEAKYLKLDSSKARALIGWNPRLNLDQTLEWTLEWYSHWMNKGDVVEKTHQQIEKYFSLKEVN